MAVGSQDTPKGTHASDILARAAQEAATACGKRSEMKRKKGQFGCGPYADEPWSLQAYQKRVYAVSAQRVARSRAASCTEALTMALTRGAAVRRCVLAGARLLRHRAGGHGGEQPGVGRRGVRRARRTVAARRQEGAARAGGAHVHGHRHVHGHVHAACACGAHDTRLAVAPWQALTGKQLEAVVGSVDAKNPALMLIAAYVAHLGD